jgi:hypothetical protein
MDNQKGIKVREAGKIRLREWFETLSQNDSNLTFEKGKGPFFTEYFKEIDGKPFKGRGYQPDFILFSKMTKRLMLIEVENISTPAKIFEDVICCQLLSDGNVKEYSGYKVMLLFITDQPGYIKNWIKLIKNTRNNEWLPIDYVYFNQSEPFDLKLFEINLSKIVFSFFD